LVSREFGLIAFAFETSLPGINEGEKWKALKDEQDRVYFALRTHLAKYQSLRKGRDLGVEVNALTLVPVLSDVPLMLIWQSQVYRASLEFSRRFRHCRQLTKDLSMPPYSVCRHFVPRKNVRL